MPDMRVGRDVSDRLVSRITSALKLVPGEHIAIVVRLHGRKPPADCMVITNARLISIASTLDPVHLVQRQVLADEIGTWRLSRKIRSRLVVTSGYGRVHTFASGFGPMDDDMVDDGITALITNVRHLDNVATVRTLRAHAHWMSGVHGRSVYVLDRSYVAPVTADALDLDMVEHQLSQFEHWPSSEVQRHLNRCLPLGGCHLANHPEVDAKPSAAVLAQAHEIADAVATVDAARLRRTSSTEAEVLQRLMSVVAHIRANPVWQSSRLDDEDLRVDLNREIRDIALRCHRAAQLRSEVGIPPQRGSATGKQAAEIHTASMASLDAVAERLEQRVTALASYRDRLRVLSREFSDIDDATRIGKAAEKVFALAAETLDDTSADPLPGLIPRSREGDEAIPKVLSGLRDDVSRLREGDPQTV